jgi:hypothetical protein
VAKPVDAEMCRWACRVAAQDYNRFLHELGDFVLQPHMRAKWNSSA